MNKVAVAILLIFLLQGQGDQKVQKAVDLARKVSDNLVDSVKATLFKELGKGGYLNAISACSNLAQDIIKAHQSKYGIYVRRVSEKYRNKLDKPDDYELAILKKLDELNREGNLPQEYYEVVNDKDGRYLRYFKPLIVQPMCLNCHGTDDFLSKEIKNFLKEKYPEDKATGYKAGDFRGAVSVKIKLDE
jgi:hypothetical protein